MSCKDCDCGKAELEKELENLKEPFYMGCGFNKDDLKKTPTIDKIKLEIEETLGPALIESLKVAVNSEIKNNELKQSKGSKFDSQKARLDLVPAEFTIEVANAFAFGASKYSEHNFKNGIQMSRLLAAAKRHIELEQAGIKNDKDSNLSHLAHAGASLAMYAFMKAHRPDMDDRYKYTEEEKQKIEEMMYGAKK